MKPLVCTHPETGEEVTFYYDFKEEPRQDGLMEWSYHVWAATQRDGDFYEARFVALGEDRVRPDVLENRNDARYCGKGITEAVFEDLVARSNRRLVSSRKIAPDDGREWRTSAADRMWEKLKDRNKATFDPNEGRFIYLSRMLHRPDLGSPW
jgi:hypothetical protein